MTPSEAIGRRVLLARHARGLSQQQLATLCGVSLNTIWNIENGKKEDRGPSVFIIQSIARELGVSTDFLLGLTTRFETAIQDATP